MIGMTKMVSNNKLVSTILKDCIDLIENGYTVQAIVVLYKLNEFIESKQYLIKTNTKSIKEY